MFIYTHTQTHSNTSFNLRGSLSGAQTKKNNKSVKNRSVSHLQALD